MMVQHCPALTGYHEPSMVQSQTSDSISCRGQAGHQLPGSAPHQGLGRFQGDRGVWRIPPPCDDINLQKDCKYMNIHSTAQYEVYNEAVTPRIMATCVIISAMVEVGKWL